MIWDSIPWKRDLARRAAKLRTRRHQRRWLPASLANVEADTFVAAYAIRKLIEAKKVSDETEMRRIPARAHALVNGPVDHWNWHKLEELYDLATSRRAELSLESFCNQVIHSFVFVAVTDDEGLEGFFVASDRERRRRLLHFALPDVLNAIEAVARDDIVSSRTELDPSTGERVVVRKSNRPSSTI